MNRRGFITGLGLAIAAPAIIRTPGLLMPVKNIMPPLALGVLPPGVYEGSFVSIRYDYCAGRILGMFRTTNGAILQQTLAHRI